MWRHRNDKSKIISTPVKIRALTQSPTISGKYDYSQRSRVECSDLKDVVVYYPSNSSVGISMSAVETPAYRAAMKIQDKAEREVNFLGLMYQDEQALTL